MRAAAARGGDGAWAHAERCDVEDECRMSVRVPRHAAARLASCLSKAGGRARGSQRERAMSDMQSDRVQCYKCFSGSVFIRGRRSAIGTLALVSPPA